MKLIQSPIVEKLFALLPTTEYNLSIYLIAFLTNFSTGKLKDDHSAKAV